MDESVNGVAIIQGKSTISTIGMKNDAYKIDVKGFARYIDHLSMELKSRDTE